MKRLICTAFVILNLLLQQRTLRLLARTLRLPVFGTLKPLMKSHYDERGFNPAFAQVLVEASELV